MGTIPYKRGGGFPEVKLTKLIRLEGAVKVAV